MVSEQLLVEQIATPDRIAPRSHPTNSSRLLQGLMSLSQRAGSADDRDSEGPHSLGGAISRSVLRSLLSALHYRDVNTVEHARRTALLATGVAERLRWEGAEIKRLEVAALLHDIGKIGVPDNILFKPGPLSTDEAELMALHHHTGIDVLQACHVDSEVLGIIHQAHRFYDGVGEVFRGGAQGVHLGARILAAADAYDSLSHDQVYRRGKSHRQVMEILTEASGTRFDGNVVATLGRWLESEGLPYAEAGSEAESPVRADDATEVSHLCHMFSYLYVLESLYDGFYLVDSDLRLIVWNQSAESLLGRPASEMRGQTWTSRLVGLADRNDRVLPDERCPLRRVIEDGRPTTSMVKLQHTDGHWVEVELQSMPLLDGDGNLQGVAEILRDVNRTSRRPREFRELKLAATRDALTMLANRGELETQIAALFETWTRSNGAEPFSVIFADIDFFKKINDSFGHSTGDRVLIDAARLLQKETYSGELVCRYGGEEFVILCPTTRFDDAYRRAERLRVALSRSSLGGLSEFKVTASFGVAEVEAGDSVESVLRRADKGLYMAKQNGRNRTCSLTSEEVAAGKADEAVEDQAPEPFVFKSSLRACVAADMIVYKLGGFVSDQHAKLITATATKAVVHVGASGLLPFWGRTADRQPVEITITFDHNEGPTAPGRRAPTPFVRMNVCVRPRGWVRNAETFDARARYVIKELRSYFVAE
jgi:diguanylate cyclase (GGDEF)-like protein/PAS domain S-box-containing protein/putative nucleotidyltransferase with HDIG domain